MRNYHNLIKTVYCTDKGEKIYIGFYLHPKHLEIFMGGDCHTEGFVLSNKPLHADKWAIFRIFEYDNDNVTK